MKNDTLQLYDSLTDLQNKRVQNKRRLIPRVLVLSQAIVSVCLNQGILQEFVTGEVFGFVGGVYENCASEASKKIFLHPL